MREKATRGPNAVLGRGGSLRSASLPAAHTVVAARRLTPDPERVRIILLYVHLLANPPLSTQPLLSAPLPEDGYWPSCLHMRAKSRPAHIREALSEQVVLLHAL